MSVKFLWNIWTFHQRHLSKNGSPDFVFVKSQNVIKTEFVQHYTIHIASYRKTPSLVYIIGLIQFIYFVSMKYTTKTNKRTNKYLVSTPMISV